MAEGYEIIVGRERPEKVITGAWNKETQQPGSETFETYKAVGTHLLINQAFVWGRRVIKDANGKVTNEGTVEVTDLNYKGEIEFLKWGHEKGAGIKIRYNKTSHSLDEAYQEQRQKLVIDKNNPREISDCFIELVSGANRFDKKTQALLIKFLQVHPGNRNSVSKNPDPVSGVQVFYEKENVGIGSGTSILEQGLEAQIIVKDASKDAVTLRNLFDIMGRQEVMGDVDELSKDGDIYTALLLFAQQNAEVFFGQINTYKKKVSDAFEKAKTLELLDLTKDGVIQLVKGNKKEPLFEGIKAKGADMLAAVLSQCYEGGNYEKVKYLITELDQKK